MNLFQKRQNIRLPEYDYAQNGAYFVTICTQRKQKILGHIVGGDAHIAPQMELSQYGMIVQKYLQSIPGICKYVIMPNHVHLIVMIENGPMWASAPTQPLGTRIRSFKTLVSKEIEKSIWQRSYYDHVVRNEQEYRRVWQYIDENPAKWAEDEYYSE